jgi:type I restriction enzyme, S subunit
MNILDLFEIETKIVDSSKIKLEESRIDPQFFSTNQSFIGNLETKPLSDFCEELFNPPVFKREFLEDSNECRYLASAEIASFEPEITYITNSQADALRLRVKRGWILITGFGTIGSIRISDLTIDGFAVANNVTRAIVKEKYRGYIATFLSSNFGNKLLNDYAAGAVVKYIEAPQIAKIPVPVLDESIIESINLQYLTAVTCREQAHDLLQKAQQLLLKYNNLPPLSDIKLETLDTDGEVEIRMTGLDEFTEAYRLDAHFYNPTAKFAVDEISKTNFQLLRDLSNEIILGKRFKRNYVESNFGTPFLGGKNIIQIRPELKYLSDTEISFIDELLIKRNWTLISCSGTLGRVCFVYDNYENYAASQHILRVNPNEDLVDPAYLNCFLSSKYGYYQLLRYRYGSVIDEIDDKNIEGVLVPLPSEQQQKEIGDLVRKAYELRAAAIKLEDEAQELLIQALTQA